MFCGINLFFNEWKNPKCILILYVAYLVPSTTFAAEA